MVPDSSSAAVAAIKPSSPPRASGKPPGAILGLGTKCHAMVAQDRQEPCRTRTTSHVPHPQQVSLKLSRKRATVASLSQTEGLSVSSPRVQPLPAKDGDEGDTNSARLDDNNHEWARESNRRIVIAESPQNLKRKRAEYPLQISAAPHSNKRMHQDDFHDDEENDEPDDGGAFDLESNDEGEFMTAEVGKDTDVAEERGETEPCDSDFPAINSAINVDTGAPPANDATDMNNGIPATVAAPATLGASSGDDGLAVAPSASTMEGTTTATATDAAAATMAEGIAQSMSYEEMILFAAAVACVSPQVVEAFIDIANLREVSNGVVLSCRDMKKYLQFKPLYQEWQTSSQSSVEEPLPSPLLTREESDIII